MNRPIFIVGTMRSGSTLLRLILDSHPHIAIGEETGFARSAVGIKKVPDFHSGAGWYEGFGLSEQDINARIRALYSEIFSAHAARQGKRRWGDKTPFHAMYMDELATIFPDSVFIGMVRHPGAVAVSKMRRNSTLEHAIANWVRVNTQILRMSRVLARDRLAVLRYEDLITHAEPTLRQLLSFLDEPWSDDLLHHQRVHRERGTPRIAAGGTRSREPIDAERVGAWTKSITPDQLHLVGERTAGLREVFAYDELSTMPLATRAAAVYILDGEALRQARRSRRAEWRQAVRSLPPRQERLPRTPPSTAQRLARMLRTDALYSIRRLPLIRRARTNDRA